MHWVLFGTWNLQKLQLELKYFGKNDADAKLKQINYLAKFCKVYFHTLQLS
jgi:hypothetical protein